MNYTINRDDQGIKSFEFQMPCSSSTSGVSYPTLAEKLLDNMTLRPGSNDAAVKYKGLTAIFTYPGNYLPWGEQELIKAAEAHKAEFQKTLDKAIEMYEIIMVLKEVGVWG